MKVIRSVKAYYPMFHLGCEPRAVECELRILECVQGKRYLKTPFAMLNAYADDDCERQFGRGYFATEAECLAYLKHEYPNWERAAPIMEALFNARRHYGEIVGPARIADKIGANMLGPDNVHQLARGHRAFTLKAVKQAVKALA